MARAGVSAVLDRVDDLATLVRADAGTAERCGQLTDRVVDGLHDAGLFRMLVPPEHDGLGLTLPESIEVFERIARADAATAWTLAILADGPLVARQLPAEVFAELCAQPRALIAGTLNPAPTRAVEVDGGYRFSGTATYLSGSAHATWLLASAVVLRDGRPAFSDGGIEIRAGLFPLTRATSLDNWNVTGMRATGSTDYSFQDVDVDEAWTFAPLRPRRDRRADVYATIPLWSQLGGGLTAVAVGTARNMLDRFIELAVDKVPVGNVIQLRDRGSAQIAVGEAHGLYQAAHAVLLQTVRGIWAAGEAGDRFSPSRLAEQRLGYVTAVRLAAQAIDLLHDAAGMTAVATDGVLDRCWRDVHTMTQHTILSPARLEIAGRVLLGLEPGSPVI